MRTAIDISEKARKTRTAKIARRDQIVSRRKNARLLEKRKKGTHLKVQHREN